MLRYGADGNQTQTSGSQCTGSPFAVLRPGMEEQLSWFSAMSSVNSVLLSGSAQALIDVSCTALSSTHSWFNLTICECCMTGSSSETLCNLTSWKGGSTFLYSKQLRLSGVGEEHCHPTLARQNLGSLSRHSAEICKTDELGKVCAKHVNKIRISLQFHGAMPRHSGTFAQASQTCKNQAGIPKEMEELRCFLYVFCQ